MNNKSPQAARQHRAIAGRAPLNTYNNVPCGAKRSTPAQAPQGGFQKGWPVLGETQRNGGPGVGGEPKSLSLQTAGGFLWMLGQTVGSKVAGLIGQIVLARLLLPRDFGLVALAYTAVAFTGVIRQTGIQQILIQRQKHFRRWANPAFWFELTVGIATAMLLIVASPVAAVVFHSKALIGLILVIATAAPLSPWFVIPTARLMIDMRFKAIAVANIAYNFIAMAISIVLAWRGFGAYSFVIPLPVAGAIRAFWLWRLAKPRITKKPQLRRWKFLVGDSLLMLAAGFVGSIMFWSGNLVLGVSQSKAAVGQFFFALNLSMQLAQLISQNLGSVLLPALAKLQSSPERQASAILLASRMLAFAGVPACLLLAVVAKPLIVGVYGAKWLPAVGLFQILLVATAISIPGGPAATALQSQGRFGLQLKWISAQAVVLLAAVSFGSWVDSATGVAAANMLFQAIAIPIGIRLGLRAGGNWGEILKVYYGPVCSGILSLGLAVAVRSEIGASSPHWISESTEVAVFLASTAILAKHLSAQEYRQATQLLIATISRTFPPPRNRA